VQPAQSGAACPERSEGKGSNLGLDNEGIASSQSALLGMTGQFTVLFPLSWEGVRRSKAADATKLRLGGWAQGFRLQERTYLPVTQK
jgi:hypothetical protein